MDERTEPVVRDERRPVSPTGGKRHVELSPIHDFARKLVQPDVLPRLAEYVRWQAAVRAATAAGRPAEEIAKKLPIPGYAPVSINLDLTTSCNFACDHCVDMRILNTGIRYDLDDLLASLTNMAERGLRSVIVIGGGEPTVHPRFGQVIGHMKDLGLQVSIVSNGSGNAKIREIAPRLGAGDWVRLSLDAGTDETFQAMHLPKKAITLDQICEGIRPIKEANPVFPVGFSFIVTWRGAEIHESNIVENIGEMVLAAERARRYGFDYIAFKPFLTRAERNNAEIVDLSDEDAGFDDIVRRIRAAVDEAKSLETPSFRVYETTNLKVLENRSYRNYTQQPRQCHLQFFRQVLSPLGTYNCPVYRNQPHGQVGPKDSWATPERAGESLARTAALVRDFDATSQCREVTCLYNHANWWLEDLIEHPEKLDAVPPSKADVPDYFL